MNEVIIMNEKEAKELAAFLLSKLRAPQVYILTNSTKYLAIRWNGEYFELIYDDKKERTK